MKKLLLQLIVGILILSCASSKHNSDNTRYFNEKNKEIKKEKFDRIRSSNKLLDIPGDSLNHKRLTLRENRGKINNRSYIESLLEKQIGRELDASKPIIIVYYPGKDPCNSGGSATKASRKLWYEELEEGINQIAQTKPLYIYKESDGLNKYKGVMVWHKDPENIIEQSFFNYHYPCSSFVVISKNGNYISYFGEFGKDYVWKATRLMNN